MSNPDTRDLFISHMKLGTIGQLIFVPQSQVTRDYLATKDALGYIYIDKRNQSLCVKFEAMYVEIDLELGEYWVDSVKKISKPT